MDLQNKIIHIKKKSSDISTRNLHNKGKVFFTFFWPCIFVQFW